MKVKFSRKNDVTITMSHEELIIIRYTLDVGALKLEDIASYMKALNDKEALLANITAQEARNASKALETAVKEYLLKG